MTIHEERRRILIIRPSALGDTLLLAPGLYQLAHEAALTVVGRRPGIDFLTPLIEKSFDYEKGGWHTLFSQKPTCRDLPALDLERIICFLTDPDGDASKGLRACFPDTPLHCFRPFPSKEENIHVAHYLTQCLHASGLPVDPQQAMEEAARTPLLDGKNHVRAGDMVVIHPGSGGERKNYGAELWFDLLREVCLELFHRKIVLLGPAEEELYERFEKERWDSSTEIIRCPQKDNLVSLLNEAALYIGHDSGITHLSALLGTPTIALFRNSRYVQWAPLGPNVTVIPNGGEYRVIFERTREVIHQNIRHR
ncbi:MAG: glycosyltransferase family 9 protein [Deltaproteobacteria bacterium]|nr:glycosyltransferase family 9 protein [Deltaproteobacteria bacterium]